MDKELQHHLTVAAAEAARVVRGVRDDQFGDATPDTEWTVRELAGHLVLWTAYSFEKRGLKEAVGDDLTGRDFTAEDGWREAYAARLDRALAVWASPAAWEGEIDTGDSAMAPKDIAAMILLELVLHGWDLARATGQEYRAADDLASAVYETVAAWAEMYRQYDGFAAPVDAGGAPVLERALALSGRDPRWSGA